jgi:hypothetical protein
MIVTFAPSNLNLDWSPTRINEDPYKWGAGGSADPVTARPKTGSGCSSNDRGLIEVGGARSFFKGNTRLTGRYL